MEIASNKGVIADASTPAGRAGMSESEWREAIKFDSTDTGWVIMSIGMAIGAGIVFLPVQVGLDGIVGIFALIGDWLPGNVSVSAIVY
ncbi:TPA: septum formation protein [Escherichia coli]|nr:septum formation protein [Escherichia coli]